MTEGIYYFILGELLFCQAYALYEVIRAEREDALLPPGVYRLTWG